MLIQILPVGFEPSASRPVTIPTRPLNLGLLGKGTSSILMSSVVDREAINTKLWLMETHQKIKNNNVALVSSVSLALSSLKGQKNTAITADFINSNKVLIIPIKKVNQEDSVYTSNLYMHMICLNNNMVSSDKNTLV